MPEPERPAVYIVSDSLGETADQVAKAALSQFDSGLFRVVRMPKISSGSQIEGIVKAAATDRTISELVTDAVRDRLESLRPGHALRGPALVVQEDATTVLLPGWEATVDPWLNLVAQPV